MRKLLKRAFWLSVFAGIGYAVFRVVRGGGSGDESTAPEGAARRRLVTATAKSNGTITGLAGPWGAVAKEEAVEQIRGGEYEYYVAGASDYTLQVIEGATGPYLRTEPGGGLSNNLDQLPDA